MLSAFKDDYTKEENIQRTKQLEKDLYDYKLGYSQTIGRYIYMKMVKCMMNIHLLFHTIMNIQ